MKKLFEQAAIIGVLALVISLVREYELVEDTSIIMILLLLILIETRSNEKETTKE